MIARQSGIQFALVQGHGRRATRSVEILALLSKRFPDPTYVDWERGYKWDAHLACEQSLGRSSFAWLHRRPAYRDIAERAIRIESRTNWRYAGLAPDMFSADGVAEVSFIDAFFTNGTFIPQAFVIANSYS